MKAAIVRAAGQTPVYGDFAEPTAAPGELRITVTAAALSPLAKGRAAGSHYSASGDFPAMASGGSTTDGESISCCRERPGARWRSGSSWRLRNARRCPTGSTT